ncbi:Mbov_0401 family ICE element transposase-like protein [Mycoplasma sp. 3686d]|uniref:Mbov_0401 family ICE element transposase-like protein n=1 Tax=Mycoplasma sp. 3686d TaxID=2967300 RepID=UPI00211BF31C|nr:UPF0236 family protein [Mycoplasma sp. 3686d]UUM24525.1 UPF0236 family protein [Mycoplasma sp. 3686d]
MDNQTPVLRELSLTEQFWNSELLFKNSKQRKELGWTYHDSRPRKIYDRYGVLLFKYIRYKDKNKKICRYNNPVYQFPKNKNFSEWTENKIKEKLQANPDIQMVLNIFDFQFSSRIPRIILRSLCTKPEKIIKKYKHQTHPVLYLNIDDAFLNLKNNKGRAQKYRFRNVLIHGGAQKVKNKTKLIKKSQFVHISKVGQGQKFCLTDFCCKLKKFIKDVYGNKIGKIVVFGDGAKFIKEINDFLQGEFVLDKYHLMEKLNKLVGTNPHKNKNAKIFKNVPYLFEHAQKLINNDQAHKAIEYLKEEFEKIEDLPKEKTTELKQFITYVKNNVKGIDKYKSLKIGSSTETSVYHNIKIYLPRNHLIGISTAISRILTNTFKGINVKVLI